MKTYLFNPEHDMALANGTATYQPPKGVRALADDLSMLPLWYADDGSSVLVSRPVPSNWNSYILERLEITTTWRCSYDEDLGIDEFCPWGDDSAVYRRYGVCARFLDFDKIRQYSSRVTAVEVSHKLRTAGLYPAEMLLPRVVRSLDELEVFLFDGPFVLKAPLSGSGRGLMWCREGLDERARTWVRHILRKQGAVIAEQIFMKKHDFAMEFTFRNGVAEFSGFSFFFTDDIGVYRGNVLADDGFIRGLLASYVSDEYLENVKTALEHEISGFALPDGRCVGVDMMVCILDDGSFAVNPCVEINVRTTMGVVSRLFYDRFVSPGSIGSFVIKNVSRDGVLQEMEEKMKKAFPVRFDGSRIVSGFVPLTPVFSDTHSCAMALITG